MGSPFDERLDAVLEEQEAAPVEPIEPAVQRDILSLIQIGKLEVSLSLYGHDFVLKTLNMEEELQVEQLLSERYASSFNEKAYRTAMVAASISSYNGMPLASSLGPDENTLPRAFTKVKQWYRPVIYALYERCQELEQRQQQAVDELAKKDETGLSS